MARKDSLIWFSCIAWAWLVACSSDAGDDDQGSGGAAADVAGSSGKAGGASGTGGTAAGSGGNATASGTSTGGRTGSVGSGGAGGSMSSGSGGMLSAGTGGMGAGGASDSDAGPGGGSDILAPENGALLGAFYGAGSIEQTTQKLGRALAIHLTYYAWGDDWTKNSTKSDLDAGRIPLVNWEPYDTTLDAIIDGSQDSRLHQLGVSAKNLNKKFFFDFGAEMNGDWSPWSGADNGMSADKYIAAYRHLHDIFAGEGATNMIWAWCPNVTDEPRSAWNETLNYYPGDDYVDWTCVDGYNWGGSGGGGGWQSFKNVFEDIYAKLASKNKPILIGEMASAEGSSGQKGDWIEQMIPTLRDGYPLIKAVVWFDIDKENDWRISSSPESEAAFKQMANDPYFDNP